MDTGFITTAGALALHFIALVFFTGMLDNLEEGLEKAIGKEIPDWFGFIIVWAIAFFIVWVGDWRFMSFLGYESVIWWGIWVEWGLSSLVIAAGTSQLQKKFDLINAIPSLVGNIRAAGKTKPIQDPNQPTQMPIIYDPNDPKI